MPADDQGSAAQRLRDCLTRLRNARATSLNDSVLRERLLLLKDWQVQRLSNTYADLLADARYGPATEFFRNDLYGPKDFSQRDRDVERIYSTMVKIMPAGALRVVATALELEALSEELDLQLVETLGDELTANAELTLVRCSFDITRGIRLAGGLSSTGRFWKFFSCGRAAACNAAGLQPPHPCA